MRFIDLFCGIGGFRVALENLGHECVFSCDIDRKAQDAYQANFGERPAGDITDVAESEIPKHEVLCAGFPCQPFSISGKHNGINDDRGKLFFEIVRLAHHHKPKILLLENVKNILTMDNQNVIRLIKMKLDEIGYEVHYHVSNSSFFGTPQSRERVYFVCLRKGEGLKYNEPKPTNKSVFLKSILMDNDDCRDLIVERPDTYLYDKQVGKYEMRPIRIGHVNKAHQGERIYSEKGHSVTIAATTGGAGANTGLYLVKGKIRRLHVEECKKLMGFPKRHKVTAGREGYKQLGNAVMPTMITRVFEGIGK